MAYQPLTSLPQPSMGPTPQNPPLMSPTKISPLGVKASSPESNVQPKNNNIAQAASSGSSLSFPGLIGSYVNTAMNGSAELNKAQSDKLDFEKTYSNIQNNIGSRPNPFGFMTGVGALEKNRYAQLEPAYEQNITNAQNLQSQRLGALNSAANQVAPHWNGYVGLNPLNNQPIGDSNGGGSNLNGLIGWGAGLDYAATSATAVKNNEVAIGTARNQGQSLLAQLQSNPDYNSNPVNLWNTVVQEIQSNVSNPKYSQIDQSVKNVLSNYAQVLGEDPATLLIQGAQAPSLAAFLKNLDDLATRKNDEQKRIGLGGSPTAAPNYGSIKVPTPTTQPQSFTRKNGSVVYLQSDGTYQ